MDDNRIQPDEQIQQHKEGGAPVNRVPSRAPNNPSFYQNNNYNNRPRQQNNNQNRNGGPRPVNNRHS
ncbi:hypothetical protein JTB14_016872 [Gonioctena quinquepunctata]|nr:hypothetical protein JTB14_016872 [Gonioctena quinquepunctata]